MFRPTKIIDIELSRPIASVTALRGYQTLQALIRLHGVPLGYIYVPVVDGVCSASAIVQAILPDYAWAISRQLLINRLTHPAAASWQIADLLHQPPVSAEALQLPSVSVVVCPQGSNVDLQCLSALQAAAADPGVDLEVLVVLQRAQSDEKHLLQTQYPEFRYLCPPEPGLSQARNLAIAVAQGEIIAFVDESSRVDRHWASAIATAFAENPDAMAVAGFVMLDGIDSEAQHWFDWGYGLGRGCERQWHRWTQPPHWSMLGIAQYGSSANLAFRRRLFDKIGEFDAALEMPAIKGSGSDLELVSRLLLAGETLLYEPSAIVRYRAPQDDQQLQAHIASRSRGFRAYLAAGMRQHPAYKRQFLTLTAWKLSHLLYSLLRPTIPRRLIATELRAFLPPLAFHCALRAIPALAAPSKLCAVRSVDVSQPLTPLTELSDYRLVRVFVFHQGMPIGSVDIEHPGESVSVGRLRGSIATHLTWELLAIPLKFDKGRAWAEAQTALSQWLTPIETPTESAVTAAPVLPDDVSVSIVITTCDRPDDLSNCLRHLLAQQTQRPVEIVVADNRPASGITPAAVAQFPSVRLVQEARAGGSYGRNAAIAASTGDIIVTVDDDITVPPDWLEKLVAPLARPEVMVVTGNVLPRELDTPAQVLFEKVKGGIGKGNKSFEVDGAWLASFKNAPPAIGDLGVSANAAFRASIFHHPQIGLMNEVLGPGTPTVGGEENYLMYKVLKAGFTLVYQPDAWVWHRHRRDLPALYRQVYGHIKGWVACHLVIWLCDKDRRALRMLTVNLPQYYRQQIISRLRGKTDTPWQFIWAEFSGYFTGFWGYWLSCQRVKRLGRSAPYIPVSNRPVSDCLTATSVRN
jgi:GT2 family glycosyltransferase